MKRAVILVIFCAMVCIQISGCASFPKQSDGSVTLEVDYTIGLKKAIEAGKFSYVGPQITDIRFPYQPAGYAGRRMARLKFMRFVGARSLNEITGKIEKIGYRPANIAELLALFAKYPDGQIQQYPIVALGSAWHEFSGEEVVPIVNMKSEEKMMGVLAFSSFNCPRCHVLIADKSCD